MKLDWTIGDKSLGGDDLLLATVANYEIYVAG